MGDGRLSVSETGSRPSSRRTEGPRGGVDSELAVSYDDDVCGLDAATSPVSRLKKVLGSAGLYILFSFPAGSKR